MIPDDLLEELEKRVGGHRFALTREQAKRNWMVAARMTRPGTNVDPAWVQEKELMSRYGDPEKAVVTVPHGGIFPDPLPPVWAAAAVRWRKKNGRSG
jgi:hypothetical protein